MNWRSNTGLSRRSFLGLGLGGLGAVLGAESLWYEPRALEITRHGIPSTFPGPPVRLLQVSDLHLNEFNHYFAKVAKEIDKLRPDLIVLTGDYLEEERNIRAVLEFLSQIKAEYGVYAVQGNWEYWSRLEGENLRRHFAGVGIKLLINERADLQVRQHHLSILGLDYPSGIDPLLHLQSTADTNRFNLLLSHVPAFAHEKLENHIDLILSGHTHGGQVRLPWLPPFYLPRYAGRFIAGMYQVSRHKVPLYVSRGIGTSVLPIRFCCRPEMTLFELGGTV